MAGPNPYRPATVSTVHEHLRRVESKHRAMIDEVVAAASKASEDHNAKRPVPVDGDERTESEAADGGPR